MSHYRKLFIIEWSNTKRVETLEYFTTVSQKEGLPLSGKSQDRWC